MSASSLDRAWSEFNRALRSKAPEAEIVRLGIILDAEIKADAAEKEAVRKAEEAARIEYHHNNHVTRTLRFR
jgi:hypothetical protein